jgi:competence protein ComEC
MQLILSLFLATLAGLILAPLYIVPIFFSSRGVVLCLCLLLLFRNFQFVVRVSLCVLFFLISNFHYSESMTPLDDVLTLDQLSRPVVVVGVISDVRNISDERTRIDVLIDETHFKTKASRYSKPLKLRLYLGQKTDHFLPGDKVRFKSRLRQPRLFKSPGEFNWPRYLSSQHIDLTGWVTTADEIKVLGDQGHKVRRMIAGWRSEMSSTIERHLSERRAQLVRALLLGESRMLTDAIRKILSQSGASHLFAISGLHLGLIALLAYRLAFCLYRFFPACLEWQPPQRILPLVILPLLFVYLIFTGDAVSTRRAFVLSTLGAGFLLWRYCVNPLILLVSLALLSLLVNPLLLWQAGWQLSFAGAAGILVWQPWWQHERISCLAISLRYPAQLILVTTAATLATLPLVLMNFHLIAPASIIANLICVPVVTLFVLPLGLCGLILFPLLPDLVVSLFNTCGILLEILIDVVSWIVCLPGFSGWTLFLTQWQYLTFGIISTALLIQARSIDLKQRLVIVVVTIFISTCLWFLPVVDNGLVSLTMFSVGQGESILLQNQQGQTVLIDGGGLYSKRFDVGERLLAPALGSLKINRLDAVILTHDHPDHRKGLIYLLNNFSVDRFYTAHEINELHPSLVRALQLNKIPNTVVGKGWSHLDFWRQGKMLVHHSANSEFSENDSSVSLYLNVGVGDGLLLTGDLEKEGVLSLLEAGIPGPVSLLKLPHHGSRYSMIDKLIDQLKPQYSLASVGYQNRYRLPAREVVELLDQRGVDLFRTDVSGTIMARYEHGRWHFLEWNQGYYVDKRL